MRVASKYWKAAIFFGLATAVLSPISPVTAAPGGSHAYVLSDREVLQRQIAAEAQRRGVPPALALAVAEVESGFDPSAESHKGARGIMQMMPATAKGEFQVDPEALWDADTNIRLGISFLADLYNTYGSWELALSHYNGGSLERSEGVWKAHSYTQDYVDRVLALEKRYNAVRWVRNLGEEPEVEIALNSRRVEPNEPASFANTREGQAVQNHHSSSSLRRQLAAGTPLTNYAVGGQASQTAVSRFTLTPTRNYGHSAIRGETSSSMSRSEALQSEIRNRAMRFRQLLQRTETAVTGS